MDMLSFQKNGPGIKKGVLVIFSRAIKTSVHCIFGLDRGEIRPKVSQVAIGANINQSVELRECYERIQILERTVEDLKMELREKKFCKCSHTTQKQHNVNKRKTTY